MKIDEIALSLADKIGIVADDCEIVEFAHALLAELAKQGPVAYMYPGSAIESKSLAFPEQLDDEQIANCVPLYAAPIPPAVPEGWKRVPIEVLDRFPEINPSNYDHDDVCALNAWGVELVLAAAPTPKEES